MPHCKLVPLVLALTALGGTALGAEFTAGHPPSAEGRGSRAYIESGAVPMPVPRVSAGLGRDVFSGDPSKIVARFGAVTRHRDGAITSEAPSDATRSILEKSISSSQQDGELSKFVESPDTRVRNDTGSFPNEAAGLLEITGSGNGDHYLCSASLIGPRTVLTAAHCVFLYDHTRKQGAWAADLKFSPGVDGTLDSGRLVAPYGSFDWDRVTVLEGFVDPSVYDGTYDSVMPFDMAVITLSDAAGEQVGWLGFKVDEDTTYPATIIGYPGDKPLGTQWTSTCSVLKGNRDATSVAHDCDTYEGSSGSSMLEISDDQYVRSVNVAEYPETGPNIGTRITDVVYAWILENRPTE